MGYGDLAILVPTLLGIRDLVFDLDRAGSCFDHFLSKQVGGFFITKACIDVRNDGYNMRFELIDSL